MQFVVLTHFVFFLFRFLFSSLLLSTTIYHDPPRTLYTGSDERDERVEKELP